ncbi:hypothetical protein VQ02_07305 [Methylobacterium variabile]|uniref:Zinc ribbon domain-containing protein n=1 Tax=Methylobacterium variabile TaxID=298794 RepID=A0A0J6T4E9_9HYPH|nr:hypothetical protein VQ02_07305 [Methylobacterium variabile]
MADGLLDGFEERADHVTEEVLRDGTVKGDYYDAVHESLVAKGLVLVQGPRGCGKTHMMRYTWLVCRDDKTQPLAIYVSFNRYLRLEPLLRKRPDALTIFQAWTLSRILQAADDLDKALKGKKFDILDSFDLDRASIDKLIGRLERGLSVSDRDEEIVKALTIDGVADAIEEMATFHKRKRAIILLDDAALTLTPEYLVEFFDIVRVLKRPRLSPKASIYPGTTEFGPRFHANHEGKTVTAWLPVEHQTYREIMGGIAQRRFPESSTIPSEVNDYLKYAAFGVPRAYLAMLREWKAGNYATTQQGLNTIIQSHNDARKKEFLSLGLKMPRLATLVKVGDTFFNKCVETIREANENLGDKNEKQIMFGLESSSLEHLTDRMINLLIEAGLFYEHPQVSHGGPDRTYRRLTPHLSALIAVRAFSSKSKGTSHRAVVEFLSRPSTKHPVRRQIDTLLGQATLNELKLDLPPCQVCHTARMSEGQKFCHNCGSKLVDDSTFTRLMKLPFDEVPRLTEWARQKLVDNHIRVIGDLLSLQDPGTELRKIYMVGSKRAERIVTAVESYVDEFVS